MYQHHLSASRSPSPQSNCCVKNMDEQRALLDQLFGTTRDLSETQKGRVQKVRFSDKEVCKNYLCGLCPYVAFAGTKSDMVR